MPLLPQEPTLQPMRRSSLRTQSPPNATPAQQQAIVTLAQVRCGPRAINEYVDSPRQLPVVSLKPGHLGVHSPAPLPPSPTPAVAGGGHTISLPCRTSLRTTAGSGGGGGGGGSVISGRLGGGVISSQPSKSPPLKEDAGAYGRAGDGHSSIICSQCGKCRCAVCSEPRELPVRWCCGDRYEVSARKAVDVSTCFCCVKTAFYHCGGAEEDNSCYDNPCACGGSKCCSRWTCLAASAIFLPCLCWYWPLRGCLAATTACYNCCRKKGCECAKHPTDKAPSNSSQTRRLLIESDSSTSSA